MKTLLENSRAVGSTVYNGENGHWLIVLAVHRDSDCLTQSNFRSALKRLGGESDDVAIERFSHWAVGWIDYLIVNPENKTVVAAAESICEKIENYPVLDESDFSELETEAAHETWKNCYNWRDRLQYIRKHRSQFDFVGFQDLIGCVRGNYFAGYASDLLN